MVYDIDPTPDRDRARDVDTRELECPCIEEPAYVRAASGDEIVNAGYREAALKEQFTEV